MTRLILLMCVVLITFQSHSTGLYESSKALGINQTCLSELKKISGFLNTGGLMINWAYPTASDSSSSYHYSVQTLSEADGVRTNIITLNPANDKCSWSYSTIQTLDRKCSDIKTSYMDMATDIKELVNQNGSVVLFIPKTSLYVMMTEYRNGECCSFVTTQRNFVTN